MLSRVDFGCCSGAGCQIVAQVFLLWVLFWVLSQGAVAGVVGAFSEGIVCHTFQFPPNMLSRLCASAFFLHFVSSHFVRLQIQVPDSIIQYILSLALHLNLTVFLCSQSMF